MIPLGIAIALLAGFLLALASVLQQAAASQAGEETDSVGLGFLKRLIKRPLWLAGMGTDIGAFLAQAIAIAFVPLLIASPLFASVLIFAIPLEAWWTHRKIVVSEIIWAGALAAAFAVFIIIGHPADTSVYPGWEGWVVPGAVCVAVIAVCFGFGIRKPHGATRALLLAIAAGVGLGLGNALLSATTNVFKEAGFWSMVASWQMWFAIAGMAIGTYLQQVSYEAGALIQALPATTIIKPITATLLGVIVLSEHMQASGFSWFWVGAAVAVMIIATHVLGRSSAAHQERQAQTTSGDQTPAD